MPNLEFPLPLDLNRVHQILSTHPEFSNRLVDLTVATITHAGRTMLFDLVTLATRSRCLRRSAAAIATSFMVKTLATSNSHIVKVANSTDVMAGSILISDTDTAGTVTAFSTAASSDTVTLNRTTTGSVTKGEWFVLEDIASGVWAVNGVLSNTASGATPFSATV
jgi:hypothetical protein